ncbi:MAG: aminoglycoside N(3)-acetyltransferase, partial [Firmicutes bacterium]|nr:aminoglycoside N(3)-acetyltransferase [Bacillota bacterium]
MSENELIEKTSELKTRGSISRDLKKLGLKKGMVVLVH